LIKLNMDPRTKIVLFSSAIALTFICRDIPVLLILVVLALAASILAGRAGMIMRGLRAMAPLLVIAFLLWSFMSDWSLFQRHAGGIDFQLGGFMTLRLLLILLASLMFVSLTGPSELIKALNSFRLPYGAVFILGLTLRHLYTIADDYRAIKEAQSSRGLELDRGSLIRRIRNYIPVLIPLFIRSIENAERMALAMELRSFSFERKRYLRQRLKVLDVLAIAGALTAVALSALHYWLGVI